MNTTEGKNLVLSVSALRRFAGCGYAYKLYMQGVPQRITATMWYGRLVHRIVQRVYADVAHLART